MERVMNGIWRRTLVRRIALLLAATLVFILSAPGPAQAFNRTVGPSPNGGYARYEGSLTFLAKRTFNYQIYIEDICPGDYLGAGIYYWWQHGDGTTAETGVVVKDTNGCGNGLVSGTNNVSSSKNIKILRWIGCWTNDGDPCWSLNYISDDRYNPYIT